MCMGMKFVDGRGIGQSLPIAVDYIVDTFRFSHSSYLDR